MIKIRDFASKGNGYAADEDDDIISYEPPRRTRSRSRSRSPPRYEDVPRFKDEKPLFGPRDGDGNIQVRYDNIIDGYDNDNDEMFRMEQMGLPTGFSMDMNPQKQKKGAKKTFYCYICLVELNSEDTRRSHEQGVKHLKKMQTKRMENEERYRRGEIGRDELEVGGSVVPIPNPEKSKQKIPIRIHDKIKETRDPVVGLDFVKEYIAVSDPEMEPHYECDLCGNQGIANGMFAHIMGQKHRQRFLEETNKDDPTRYLDLTQGQLLQYAKDRAENQSDLTKRIKTRRSDEAYPWPPGKAPWSKEMGGTGIAPDGARENWGNNEFVDTLRGANEVKIKLGGGFETEKKSFNISGGGGGGLPSVNSLKAPINKEEAEKMLLLGEKMVSLSIEFLGSGKKMNPVETEALGAVFKAITSRIQAKHHIQRSDSSSGQSSSGGPYGGGRLDDRSRKAPRNSRSPSPVVVKRERSSMRNSQSPVRGDEGYRSSQSSSNSRIHNGRGSFSPELGGRSQNSVGRAEGRHSSSSGRYNSGRESSYERRTALKRDREEWIDINEPGPSRRRSPSKRARSRSRGEQRYEEERRRRRSRSRSRSNRRYGGDEWS